jgi:hypothetical protein
VRQTGDSQRHLEGRKFFAVNTDSFSVENLLWNHDFKTLACHERETRNFFEVHVTETQADTTSEDQSLASHYAHPKNSSETDDGQKLDALEQQNAFVLRSTERTD